MQAAKTTNYNDNKQMNNKYKITRMFNLEKRREQ